MSDALDIIAAAAGGFLLADDKEDFGKFDRPHHWQLGAALLAVPLVRPLIEDYLEEE